MIRLALFLMAAISLLWLTILTTIINLVWNYSLHTTFPETVPTINFSQAFGYAVFIYALIFIAQFKITFNDR